MAGYEKRRRRLEDDGDHHHHHHFDKEKKKNKEEEKEKEKEKKVRSYIPEIIQRDILLKQSLKTLLRFCSVDKRMRYLISTREFIGNHVRANPPREKEVMLLLDHGWSPLRRCCCMYLDRRGSACPVHLRDLVALPYGNTVYDNVKIVDYCDGVACLVCKSRNNCDVMLWNPSIRKTVAMPAYPAGHVQLGICSTRFGFGCVDDNDDYKLVVLQQTKGSKPRDLTFELCSSRTRTWSTVVCSWPDPRCQYWQLISLHSVFASGACHWLAKEHWGSEGHGQYFVLSFDLGGNRIGVVPAPNSFRNGYASISVYRGYLALIGADDDGRFVVWVMREYGSWIRIIQSAKLTRALGNVIGFTGGGDVVFHENGELFCYSPTTRAAQPLKEEHYERRDLSFSRLHDYRENLKLVHLEEN